MKLKSYFAATVEAAMNTARLEMGADAMLVSSRRTDNQSRHLGEYEVVFASTSYQDARLLAGEERTYNQALPPKAPPIDRLSEEVAGLKHEMERLASALARSTGGMARIAANPELAEAFAKLVDAEIDADLAQDILFRVTSRNGDSTALDATRASVLIASELELLCNVDSGLARENGRNAIALVGPPG